MSDQLVGWLQVVIGVLALGLNIHQLRKGTQHRRHRRTLRLSCWRVWGFEHVRLDVTDDHQP